MIKQIVSKITPIACEEKLRLVVLFGSHAIGKAHPQSDVDIALDVGPDCSQERKSKIELLFFKAIPKVDLVFLDDASPLLLAAIAKDGKPLFEAERSLFSLFQLRAWREYFDYKPYLELRARLNRDKLKAL